VKWSLARDEDGKWRLERWGNPVIGVNGFARFAEHLASVERVGPDLASPAQYRAEVVPQNPFPGVAWWSPAPMPFRHCPTLFNSLKEAQLWCEREVRLMEIGELA